MRFADRCETAQASLTAVWFGIITHRCVTNVDLGKHIPELICFEQVIVDTKTIEQIKDL